MRTKLEQIISQFEELTVRMRLLLTLCVIAIVFMIFDILIFSPNEKQIKNKQQTNLNIRGQIEELVNLQGEFNQKTFNTRSDPRSKQLNQLTDDLKKIRLRLTEHTANLIHPEEMPDVLKNILSSTKKLRLQSLLKQEAVNLSEDAKNNQQQFTVNDDESATLYQHSIKISLYGDYPSTVNFLEKLEDMKKRVAFDNLEYIVDIYPKANIQLTISTLSLKPGWIGG